MRDFINIKQINSLEINYLGEISYVDLDFNKETQANV